jgi:hypothetical protein
MLQWSIRAGILVAIGLGMARNTRSPTALRSLPEQPAGFIALLGQALIETFVKTVRRMWASVSRRDGSARRCILRHRSPSGWIAENMVLSQPLLRNSDRAIASGVANMTMF